MTIPSRPTPTSTPALTNICRCGTYTRIRAAIKHGGGGHLTCGPIENLNRRVLPQEPPAAVGGSLILVGRPVARLALRVPPAAAPSRPTCLSRSTKTAS